MIRGELTNLRAVERTDAPRLHELFNAATGIPGWPLVFGPVSLAEMQRRVESWIDDERSLEIPVALICVDLDGEVLGVILFGNHEPNARAAEVDILFANGPQAMTDALQSVVDVCFERWNLHRITARAPVDDDQRANAFAACGFQRDAVLRQAAFFDGGYHDVALYCLLETDESRTEETNR